MADFDLNLSTQPFPAYRLTNIALICVLIALAVISVWQARGFFEYTRMASSIRTAEQDSRVEAESLAKSVAELESRIDRPESTAKLNEISFLNRLILRKNLSWTRLFGILEEMVPENVRFTSLRPEIGEDGSVTLRLGVRTRSIEDVTPFMKRLEDSPYFEKLDVRVEQKTETAAAAGPPDVELTLSAVYYPEKTETEKTDKTEKAGK